LDRQKEKRYILKVVSPSELPRRGFWKAIVLEIIDDFDSKPERYMEVLPIEDEQELRKLYDAFVAVIRKGNLNLQVRTKEGRLFLIKEGSRYFVDRK